MAALAGAVQGISEALPISSSAHLGFLRAIAGTKLDADDAKALDVALHLGSLTGPAIALRGTGPVQSPLIAATIASLPAAAAGALLRSPITRRLGKPRTTAILGGAAAVAVWLVDRRSGEGRAGRLDQLSLDDLMVLGTAQATALVPGVSRSGVVYAAARSRGLDRDSAAVAAVTMSVPVIAGAALLTAATHPRGLRSAQAVCGAAVAGVVAAAAAPLARPALARGSGTFAVYRAVLAAVLFARRNWHDSGMDRTR